MLLKTAHSWLTYLFQHFLLSISTLGCQRVSKGYHYIIGMQGFIRGVYIYTFRHWDSQSICSICWHIESPKTAPNLLFILRTSPFTLGDCLLRSIQRGDQRRLQDADPATAGAGGGGWRGDGATPPMDLRCLVEWRLCMVDGRCIDVANWSMGFINQLERLNSGPVGVNTNQFIQMREKKANF